MRVPRRPCIRQVRAARGPSGQTRHTRPRPPAAHTRNQCPHRRSPAWQAPVPDFRSAPREPSGCSAAGGRVRRRTARPRRVLSARAKASPDTAAPCARAARQRMVKCVLRCQNRRKIRISTSDRAVCGAERAGRCSDRRSRSPQSVPACFHS